MQVANPMFYLHRNRPRGKDETMSKKQPLAPVASERFFGLGTLISLNVFSWWGWVPRFILRDSRPFVGTKGANWYAHIVCTFVLSGPHHKQYQPTSKLFVLKKGYTCRECKIAQDMKPIHCQFAPFPAIAWKNLQETQLKSYGHIIFQHFPVTSPKKSHPLPYLFQNGWPFQDPHAFEKLTAEHLRKAYSQGPALPLQLGGVSTRKMCSGSGNDLLPQNSEEKNIRKHHEFSGNDIASLMGYL